MHWLRDLRRTNETQLRRIVSWFVGIAVVGVLVYSLSVLSLIAYSGDIGLRFVLGTMIRDRIETGDYDWQPTMPEVGASVTRIGSNRVRHFPDLVQALRDLKLGERVSVGWVDPSGRSQESQVVVRRRPFWTYSTSIVWFVQELFIFAIGARVFWRRPRDPSAVVFFLICVLTYGAFMGGYHWTEIVISRVLIHIFTACAVFLPWANLHFYLIFPMEAPVYSRHKRAIVTALYAIPTVMVLLLTGAMVWLRYARFGSVDQVLLASVCLKWLALSAVGISALIYTLCVICLYAGYKRARSNSQTGQIQWILLASILSMPLIAYVLYQAALDSSILGRGGAAWPMFVVSLLFTTAYAFSITRYRLLQADRLLNRGVLYLAVSVGAGLVYSFLLVVGGLFIGDRLRSGENSFEIIAAAGTALVLLVASGALREQFHKAIDRRFFREKYKFDKAVRQIEVAFESLMDRSTLSRRLLQATSEAIRSDWGSIYLSDQPDGIMRLQASFGPEPESGRIERESPLVAYLGRHGILSLDDPASPGDSDSAAAKDVMISQGAEIAVGLEASGRLAGFMLIGPKPSGLPYEPEESAFLRALGSVAGLGLHSVEMQTTLEAANRELRDKVEKIAEQQRRILVLQDQLARKGLAITGDDESLVEMPDNAHLAAGTHRSPDPADAFASIVGSSQPIRDMIHQARKVADMPSAVMIRGESGTGKELLARAIHRSSVRSDHAFVPVHCASLSGSLLESELFGHVKGAFTGADRDRIGRFEQADGGTIFLDEVGDIPLETQIKLLRVLQEKTFERVGSSASVRVDVRVIAATHRDLEAMIRDGRFREDLYYRLNVISLRTPPLRERKEDIFTLALHFMEHCSVKLKKPVSKIANDAVEALMAFDWPGNIRELENCLERAMVLTDADTIRTVDLPAEIHAFSGSRRSGIRSGAEDRRVRSRSRPDGFRSTWAPPESDVGQPMRSANSRSNSATQTPARKRQNTSESLEAIEQEAFEYERVRLLDALREAGGNRTQAARLLDIPRTTLLSRMKRHGLV
ncbi:AAA family ATPase [bacterium]|nr:AAA family ATPase [bacterium]